MEPGLYGTCRSGEVFWKAAEHVQSEKLWSKYRTLRNSITNPGGNVKLESDKKWHAHYPFNPNMSSLCGRGRGGTSIWITLVTFMTDSI